MGGETTAGSGRMQELEAGEAETMPRGDHKPRVEELPDGTKLITTRVIRPGVHGVKSKAEVKAQVGEHERFRESIAANSDIEDRQVSYPDAKRSAYDYHDLMPEIGSPDSIPFEAADRPPLIIASVRHLAHERNVVTEETLADFRERAESLIKDLDITPNTLVYVIASPTANFEAGPIGSGDDPDKAPVIHSRTQSTLDVIRSVLTEKGVAHTDDTFGIEGSMHEDGQLTDAYRRTLDEFQISDATVNQQAGEQIRANQAAKKAGEPLPYPDAPSVPATVYASDASSLADLELRTGITEMSSATVARGLAGHDMIERYFLQEGNIPPGVDKVVVIEGRHGQYATNISEALLVATDGAHPIAFAQNGGYALVEARLATDGSVVEDYIIRSGTETGMVVK